MMHLIVTLCLFLGSFLATPAGAADGNGTAGSWTAYAKENGTERIQLNLDLDGDGNMGMGWERSDFIGLEASQIRSATRVPVRFERRTEAGTITFEGTFRNGRGAGEFSFAADPAYEGKLRPLGLSLDGGKKNDEERELFQLAMFDVSTGFIRSMQEIGYDETLQKYVEFRIFKVTPAYVRDMAAVGFRNLSADKLVETRIHGVTPEYIREMRAAGEDLPLDDYIQARIFQVTPEFADEIEKAGYSGLDHDTLVQFRIHGVSPEFIRGIAKHGYRRVPADQLVQMKIHGVTPEFIARVEKAGFHDVPIDKLVQMRIFDIDPEMIGALDEGRRR